jgi:hypothetical protein
MAATGGPPTTSDEAKRLSDRGRPSGWWEDNPPTVDEIKKWQQFLIAAGFYAGQATGEWDRATSGAMKNWQEAQGFDPSGEIDGRSRAKIREIEAFLQGQAGAGTPPSTASSPAAPAATAPAPAPPAAGGTSSTPASSSTAGAATPAAPAAGGSPNPDGLFSVPGGAEIWANQGDGHWYVVYRVPGSATPLAWRIENDDDKAAIFGPGNAQQPKRTLTADQWKREGVLPWGTSRQLANLSEHPFDAFVANFNTEAKYRPWLRDEEILALTTRAMLEGRQVTEAELAGTKWWNEHTPGERAWMQQVGQLGTDGVKQKVQDGIDATRQLMIQLGISEPPEQLVELMANRVTGGTWTAAYQRTQIAKLADPAAPGALDPTVQRWVTGLQDAGQSLNTLADNTSKIDTVLRTWLGPVHAAAWSKQEKERWAGRLRNDPQAEVELVEKLKLQRKALFPEYEDPDLSYETIAAGWRGVFQSMWGEAPDETDPLFDRVMRVGGSLGTKDQQGGRAGVEELLRKEGIQRGVGAVVNNALATTNAAFGGGQRRAL